MAILKVKDLNGNFIDIPAIVGPEGKIGPVGESGVYLGSTEPSNPNVSVWIDSSEEGSALPTKVSELENDSNYATVEYVDSKEVTITTVSTEQMNELYSYYNI